MGGDPIDARQRLLAERRLLAALRRHQRKSPLRADVRVDTLVGELRDGEPGRATGHRGRQPLTLTDGELRSVVDGMVSAGTLLRSGHRVRLPDAGRSLDPIMRERLDQLSIILSARGATPPSADSVGARLGIPPALIDQLRAAGELISLAPRIDYPRQAWLEMSHKLDLLSDAGVLSVRRVRDELETTRRHAEAILRHWNRSRSTR